jgi:hypothetical protein
LTSEPPSVLSGRLLLFYRHQQGGSAAALPLGGLIIRKTFA